MALNDGDKAECKEIARQIIKEVLSEHIKECPLAQKIKGFKMLMIGLGAGLGLTIGGGSGWQLVKNIVDSLTK